MFKAQNAFEGVITNFPRPLVSAFVRRIVFPLGRPYVVPSDQLGHDVARLLIEPSATRDRLTLPMYLGRDDEDPVALIERALAATMAAEAVEAKLKAAAKDGAFDATLGPGEGIDELAARAVSAGVIDAREARTLVEQRALVAKVIRVDDFAPDLGTSSACQSDVDPPAERQPPSRAAPPRPTRPARTHRTIGSIRLATGRRAAIPACMSRTVASCHPSPQRTPQRTATMTEPIYIVDGGRTPFLKARNRPGRSRRPTSRPTRAARCCCASRSRRTRSTR